MEGLLYATIWLALALLVLAEIGRGPRGGAAMAWARPAWIVSALFAIAHALLVFHLRYGWDHETAVRETARQGAALYGMEWRGSLYVNYLFITLWLIAAWRWTHWLWRGFVLMMIVNGAILFARPIARPFGAVLVALLAWAWLRTARSGANAVTRPS